MKPVMQTKFGDEGNCFPACVASILELDLASVLEDPGTGRRIWRDFLAGFNLGMLTVRRGAGAWMPEDSYCIAGGLASRGLQHAVVWKFERDACGRLAHDPHPNGNGLITVPDDFTFFVVLDAARRG